MEGEEYEYAGSEIIGGSPVLRAKPLFGRDVMYSDIIGETMGYKVPMGAKDYQAQANHEQREANAAARAAQAEKRREWDRALDGIRGLQSRYNGAKNLTVTGDTPEARDKAERDAAEYKEEIDFFRDFLQKNGAPALYQFMAKRNRESEDSNAEGSSAVEDEKKISKIFSGISDIKMKDSTIRELLEKDGVISTAKNIEKAERLIAKNALNEHTELMRKLDARGRTLANKAAQLAGKKGEDDAETAAAFSQAQSDFLRSRPQYTPENATRLATLFKDFKSDEEYNGKTVVGIFADIFNKNASEAQKKAAFDTFVNIMLIKHKPAPPPQKKSGLSEKEMQELVELLGGKK